jgi:hypothetical protein
MPADIAQVPEVDTLTVAGYFDLVQSLWASTGHDTRAELLAAMTEAVETSGGTLNAKFPLVNKIVELRLIGRQHPLD